MSHYSLDGINFQTGFGIIPARAPGGNVAIEGIWDSSAKLGKIYHSWGDENGIEPYIHNIRLGGRDLKLYGFFNASSKGTLSQTVKVFKNFISQYTDLVTLSSNWGDYDVYINGRIDITHIKNGFASVVIPFREPRVNNDSPPPDVDNTGDFRLLGVSFESLGLHPHLESDFLSIGGPKEQNFTYYGIGGTGFFGEGYQITKKSANEFTLRCSILADSYEDFNSNIKKLMLLTDFTGGISLKLGSAGTISVLCKDGFKVSNVWFGDQYYAHIDFKFLVIGDFEFSGIGFMQIGSTFQVS